MTASRAIALLAMFALVLSGCTGTYTGQPEVYDSDRDPVPVVSGEDTQQTSSHRSSGKLVSAVEQLLVDADGAIAEKNYPRAAAMIERAIRVGSEDPRGYFVLAKLRFEQGQFAQVQPLLAKARSLAAGDQKLLRSINKYEESVFTADTYSF